MIQDTIKWLLAHLPRMLPTVFVHSVFAVDFVTDYHLGVAWIGICKCYKAGLLEHLDETRLSELSPKGEVAGKICKNAIRALAKIRATREIEGEDNYRIMSDQLYMRAVYDWTERTPNARVGFSMRYVLLEDENPHLKDYLSSDKVEGNLGSTLKWLRSDYQKSNAERLNRLLVEREKARARQAKKRANDRAKQKEEPPTAQGEAVTEQGEIDKEDYQQRAEAAGRIAAEIEKSDYPYHCNAGKLRRVLNDLLKVHTEKSIIDGFCAWCKVWAETQYKYAPRQIRKWLLDCRFDEEPTRFSKNKEIGFGNVATTPIDWEAEARFDDYMAKLAGASK